jgi:hypothetical protein
MYSRFTDRARKVMQLANQEAQRFNHEYIGTEHILLGLVKEGSCVAAKVLKNLQADLPKIRLEVEKIILPGPDMVRMGKLPQTPRAKKVIEYSIEEARALNHNYVGTEHLLLGLLREQEGVAAQVLMNLLLNVADVRRNVLELFDQNLPVAANSPSREDLIIEHVKKLPPLPTVLNAARTDAQYVHCQHGHMTWLTTLLAKGVSWGCRHHNLSTFLAGFVMTLGGSLGAWCLEVDGNIGALLAGASYIFAIGMAYWPYLDPRRSVGRV